MKLVKLLREWAWYKNGSYVIIGNTFANNLLYRKEAELIAAFPTFNYRLGLRRSKLVSPLNDERRKFLIEDLEIQIEYGKEAIKVLKELELPK